MKKCTPKVKSLLFLKTSSRKYNNTTITSHLNVRILNRATNSFQLSSIFFFPDSDRVNNLLAYPSGVLVFSNCCFVLTVSHE